MSENKKKAAKIIYIQIFSRLCKNRINLTTRNRISRDIKKETTVSTHLVCVSNYKDIVFENLKHSTLSLDDKLSILGYFGAGPEAYSYGRFDNSKFITPEERSELYDYEEKVLYGGKEYCK